MRKSKKKLLSRATLDAPSNTALKEAHALAEEVLRLMLVDPLPGPGPDYPTLLADLARSGRALATAWWTREFIRFDLPLTADMRKVAINALDAHADHERREREKGKRGPKVRNADRDGAIVYALVQASSAGLHLTRNESSDRSSACDVVSEVYEKLLGTKLAYRGIANVWEKYQRKLREGEAIADGERSK